MKSTIKNANVRYAKAFKMESNSGCYLYCEGEFISDENKEGVEISKVMGDHSVLERVRNQLPCNMDMDVEFVSGGGDKMVIRLIDFKVLDQPKAPNKAA